MSSPSVRVAIVTGAAQGIGRAIALRLAHDGLNVIVNDLPSREKQLEELVTAIEVTKQKGSFVTGDISCETDVQKLIDVAVAEFGGVDVVSPMWFLLPLRQSTKMYRRWWRMLASHSPALLLLVNKDVCFISGNDPHSVFSNCGGMGSSTCRQYPRNFSSIQGSRCSDDQARSWRKDHRLVPKHLSLYGPLTTHCQLG
jgi:short chain dehydrogenase